MSHLVVTHTFENIPADHLWDAITDLAQLARWNRACARSAVLEPGSVTVGSQARLQMEDGSELVESVTALDPKARHIAFDVLGIPAPFASLAGDMTVTPTASGCELRWESEYALKGGIFGAALDRLVIRAAMRREHRKTAADLEHHLTTGDLIGKNGARTPARAAA